MSCRSSNSTSPTRTICCGHPCDDVTRILVRMLRGKCSRGISDRAYRERAPKLPDWTLQHRTMTDTVTAVFTWNYQLYYWVTLVMWPKRSLCYILCMSENTRYNYGKFYYDWPNLGEACASVPLWLLRLCCTYTVSQKTTLTWRMKIVVKLRANRGKNCTF